ncbi:helix-hairpin-helix domain-containing protein [Nesterenkonia sphaerica]|uniref:ComEA family DNA-binding protein n=1 Tax=Nesterenkonia sphaerica TaxID=1804988 RepID=A0A5R9AND6_9MICC|nr:helix-hairpin-helix domain-containing protein [Nesterenkonia sphaerica]TLP79416.1 ComEA family DNA-binding protein [Nesterenkonia sphaerica]
MESYGAQPEPETLLSRRERRRAQRQEAHGAPVRFALRRGAVMMLIVGLLTWIAVSWVTAAPSRQALPEPPTFDEASEPRPREDPESHQDEPEDDQPQQDEAVTEGPHEPVVVHVAGAVRHPQVVHLQPGDRVADAVEAAGGLLREAAAEGANLAAPVLDGSMIYVPTAEELDSGQLPPPAEAAESGSGEPASGPVNLNSADAAELEQLSGIGPALAERIISYREDHQGFSSLEELAAVSGIGPAIIENIADDVTW